MPLVVEYSEVAGHDLVLQDRPSGDVDPVPVVGDDDDCPPQTDSPAESHIPRHRQMVLVSPVQHGTAESGHSTSSSRSGMEPNRERKAETFLKLLSPSLTSGVEGNILCNVETVSIAVMPCLHIY